MKPKTGFQQMKSSLQKSINIPSQDRQAVSGLMSMSVSSENALYSNCVFEQHHLSFSGILSVKFAYNSVLDLVVQVERCYGCSQDLL